MNIEWMAFVEVFAIALAGAAALVTLFALALRLRAASGRIPVVAPAEFTDAIAVLTDKQQRREEKAAEKAARKSPLSDAQKRLALIGSYACFALCGVAIVGAILLIIFGEGH